MDPVERVLSPLPHVDRQTKIAPGIQEWLDARAIRRGPVLVELEDRVRIPNFGEDAPVRRPMGAFVADRVIRVDLADGGGQLEVEITELIRVLVLVLVGEGLVEQVVRGHYGLVAVALSDRPPELDGEPAIPYVRKQLRRATGRVVDVGTGLTARCAMQVEHHPELVGATPFDESIDQGETFLDQLSAILDQDTRVDREPHMVHSLGTNSGDVVFG